jgi:hypothetical protein
VERGSKVCFFPYSEAAVSEVTFARLIIHGRLILF